MPPYPRKPPRLLSGCEDGYRPGRSPVVSSRLNRGAGKTNSVRRGGERQNQSAAVFAEALFARGIGVPGVIGSRGLASFFSSHWRGLVDCDVELDMDLRVYKLTRVNAKVIKAGGELRPARAGDLPFF